jgi:von Willebrand factor type A C-terminal domain/von Willebrand factor type A domain
MSTFTTECFQNEYLPLGGSEVNAIVTVTSDGAAGETSPPEAAEIVIIDTSGSMGAPRRKLEAAREATSVAIDCIRDGVAFGVIAGTEVARAVYPTDGMLVPASAQTRADANKALRRLKAEGGTAIGSWLRLAGTLFASTPGRSCHAILLTDGENQHESDEQLDGVLSELAGRFQCDCRGVGTEWKVSELSRVASALLGSVDIIANPEDIAGDFRALMQTAMGKATGNVSLRLWTPQGATVAFVRQVAPTVEDLTERPVRIEPRSADYPTATWGRESRDYQVCINVPPGEVGDEMLAGRVSLVEGDEVRAQARVKAIWTEDRQQSTEINGKVALFTGQVELARSIKEGLAARREGDIATATFKLGRAVQLAAESGHDGTMKLLQGVVEIDDAATGTIRLRRDVAIVDEMSLDTRSTITVRVGPGVT